MNAERRKIIARAVELMREASSLISQAAEGERQAFENLPESLQQGQQGQAMEQTADDLDQAVCSVNDAAEEAEGFIQ